MLKVCGAHCGWVMTALSEGVLEARLVGRMRQRMGRQVDQEDRESHRQLQAEWGECLLDVVFVNHGPLEIWERMMAVVPGVVMILIGMEILLKV